MRAKATYEAVAAACSEMQKEGEKITARAVLARIGGGSMPTVLAHIKAWREGGGRDMAVEIPDELTVAIKAALDQAKSQGVEQSQIDLEQAREAEAEAIKALAETEKQAQELAALLENLKAQAEQRRREAETAQAVAFQKIQDLQSRVESLEQECRTLSQAGEAARTAAAVATARANDLAAIKTRQDETIQELGNRLQEAEKALIENRNRNRNRKK